MRSTLKCVIVTYMSHHLVFTTHNDQFLSFTCFRNRQNQAIILVDVRKNTYSLLWTIDPIDDEQPWRFLIEHWISYQQMNFEAFMALLFLVRDEYPATAWETLRMLIDDSIKQPEKYTPTYWTSIPELLQLSTNYEDIRPMTIATAETPLFLS